jgi:hypothetical protein
VNTGEKVSFHSQLFTDDDGSGYRASNDLVRANAESERICQEAGLAKCRVLTQHFSGETK